jgi:hypothetical protein
MKKTLLSLALLLLSFSSLWAATFTVNSLANTNTGAGSSGTLRFCLNMATITPGAPHTINFSVAGTIAIVSDANALPAITQATTIDATTAPGYAGTPVVIVDYTGCLGSYGLQVNAANSTVLGLEIRYAPYTGIQIATATNNFRIGSSIGQCVVRNSGYYGIQVNGADNGTIENCRIGTNAAGDACEANGYDGIDLTSNANNNQILRNHIACNGYNGLQIGNSHNNIVKGNIFGPLMGTCTSNGYRGVDLEGGSHDNVIGGTAVGEGNKIAGNLYWGLEVKEAGTIRNVISGNSMSCNDYGAIEINTGGNNGIAAPAITAASGTTVSGTSLANAVIQVFSVNDPATFGCLGVPMNQGADYLGTTTATAGGTWSLSGTFTGRVVATQTTTADGTSMFSAAVNTLVPPVWANSCAGPFVGSGCTPPPAPTNTTPSPALTVCSGIGTTLTASGTGAIGWYTASSGGTYLGGGGSFSTGPLTTTTTFYAQDSTCDKSTTRTSITVTVSTITTSQTVNLCAGESLTVGSSVYNSSGTYTDTLTTSAGCDSVVTTDLTVDAAITTDLSFTLCAGETVTIGTSTYDATGLYTDVLTAANGCDSTVTTDLTVRPPVNVNTLTSGLTITADAFGMTYQWINCDNDSLLAGETGQSFTATFTGNYAVIITDSGCTDTSACTNVIVVGVDAAQNSGIRLWPQPAGDGQLWVEAPGFDQMMVLDLQGRQLVSYPLLAGVNKIALPELAKGAYLVRLQSRNGTQVRKLLIE